MDRVTDPLSQSKLMRAEKDEDLEAKHDFPSILRFMPSFFRQKSSLLRKVRRTHLVGCVKGMLSRC